MTRNLPALGGRELKGGGYDKIFHPPHPLPSREGS